MNDAFSMIAEGEENEDKEVLAEQKKDDQSLLQNKEDLQTKTKEVTKKEGPAPLNKFELEFIDKEDDDEDAPVKKQQLSQVDLSSITEQQQAVKRQELVQKNLAAAQKASEGRK